MRSPSSSQPKARELKQKQRQRLSLGGAGGEKAVALAVVRRGKGDRPIPCHAPVCLAFAIFRTAITLATAHALAKLPRGVPSDGHFWKG
jgi:hypothetical protein